MSEFLLLANPPSALLNTVGAYTESIRHNPGLGRIYHSLRNKCEGQKGKMEGESL